MGNRSSDEDKRKLFARYTRGTRRQQKRDDARVRWQQKRAAEGDDSRPLDDHGWIDEVEDEFEVKVRSRDRRERQRKVRAVPPAAPALQANGLVIGLTAGRATVLAGDDEIDARLCEALRSDQQQLIAVGDEVAWERDASGDALVNAVAERRSSLSRPDPGNEHRERVIVANVDRAVVVLSVVRPALRPALIDRMLVALAFGGVEPVLCINKLDLAALEDGVSAEVRACLAPYRALGIRCLETSAESGAGIDELRDAIRGHTAVFVGHSGVGKSALLNRLDPDVARAVGSGRAFDGKGRHTTRGSRMSRLDGGATRVIDTPGVRAFGLWDVDALTLAQYFPEFVRMRACRYSDCVHTVEPGCAVLAALERGELQQARYDAYLRLLEATDQ